MSLVAYVSGHGLGHAAREIEILHRLPEDIPLVIKTISPESFWREEVRRPFTYVKANFDVGAIQHTSIDTDIGETLTAWRNIDDQNRKGLDAELADLRRLDAKVIVGDIVPWAFVLAAELNLRSFCITNFTWADIYGDYIGAEPAFVPIVAELKRQYALSCLLQTDLTLPMPYFMNREYIGLVARSGNDRRTELFDFLGASAHGRRLALLYAGNWGLPLAWERLERFAHWHFVTLVAPPDSVKPIENLTLLPRTRMPHPDLVASVDTAISKPGYGLVGECLASGTPLVYCPRSGFAEYAAIDVRLQSWAGGFRIPVEQFLKVDWHETLDRVPAHGSIAKVAAPGGKTAADILTAAYRAAV